MIAEPLSEVHESEAEREIRLLECSIKLTERHRERLAEAADVLAEQVGSLNLQINGMRAKLRDRYEARLKADA